MDRFYVPILKWKQGEYLGLSRLNESIKGYVVPLIEIPVIGFDFEKEKVAKTVEEHLDPFAKRYKTHWNNRRAFIDVSLIEKEVFDDGRGPLEYIFERLAGENHGLVPVTGIANTPEHKKAVREIFKDRKKHGICVRLYLDDLYGDEVVSLLDETEAKFGDCDLILDLKAPNFSEVENFADAILENLKLIPGYTSWRSLTICGTAFPENLAGIKSPGGRISRDEWRLFKVLAQRIPKSGRMPNFGDYAISNPVSVEGDMRLITPSASIRYTIDDAWHIVKGSRVRPSREDKKKKIPFDGYGQFKNLCQKITSDKTVFSGIQFSPGDEYIRDCSTGKRGTGNLSTWRWVGNNHHITKVVTDLRASGFLS